MQDFWHATPERIENLIQRDSRQASVTDMQQASCQEMAFSLARGEPFVFFHVANIRVLGFYCCEETP